MIAYMEISTSVNIIRTFTAGLRATVQWHEHVERGIGFLLERLGVSCFANR